MTVRAVTHRVRRAHRWLVRNLRPGDDGCGTFSWVRRGLVVLALASATLPDGAAAEWGRPKQIAPWGDEPLACSTGEVVFGNGARQRFSYVRWSAGAFSRIRRLPQLPGRTTDPELACDGRGRFLVAVVQGRRISVARSAPSGAWSRLRSVSSPRRDVGPPELAVSLSGRAIVAYPARTRRGWRVEASTRARRDGRFGSPRVLSASGPDYPSVDVAIGQRGDALVTWHVEQEADGLLTGSEGPVWASFKPAGGRWAPAQALGDGGEFSSLSSAVSPTGRMLVAWLPWYYGTRGTEEPSRLMIAERAPGGAFAGARELARSTPGAVEDGGPVTSVADDGRALVAWVRPAGPIAFGTGLSTVEAFARPAGGDFTSETLTSPDGVPEFPVLSVRRDGALALGWTQASPGGVRVVFSLGELGARLGRPRPVSSRRDEPTWPTVAFAGTGDLIAAWLKGGFGSGEVMAAVDHGRDVGHSAAAGG
ncbi:hypothetical protein [Solirubrobacter soli]|uniref:hypothetical protein n=1 Tax=Solirubrobacter soli TaxID=363832 RepID=UPI00040CFB1E|nr:hypothetical protein [Solirubrobacter soli]